MAATQSGNVKITIPVSGMTCAACQSRVQRALSKQPGVSSATVNLMLNSATVEYDPSVATPEALVKTIRSTGYGAELPSEERTAFEEQEAQDAARAAEFHELRRKALVSGVIGVIAMILSMPLMAVSAHSAMQGQPDPFMRWMIGVLDPGLRTALPWLYAIDPQAISYALLVMTSVVVGWAG